MIEHIKGNLFEHKSNGRSFIIVHGCNAQGVMGSGVAKEFRARFPQAYNKYRSDIERNLVTLGQVSWYSGTPGVLLASAITQFNFGKDGKKYVSYEAVFDCLRDVFDQAIYFNSDVVMPKIGCGLGGGDWFVVSSIIQILLDERPELKVYVYEL